MRRNPSLPSDGQERISPLAKLPVFWSLQGKRAVIAGGSDGAAWKAELLQAWEAAGHLRLNTAFSRDQAEKIYVQQRMLEQGALLWQWLEAGAYFYVCGDAQRMARDVDAALRVIVAEHGRMDAAAAAAYVEGLSKARRYRRDVY